MVNAVHASPPSRIGELIANRYRITSEAGRGGSAITYLGTDTQSGREVAIKHLQLWHGAGDWKGLELFQREARTLAGIDHPSIPRHIELVEQDDGRDFYLVRDYVTGQSLKDAAAAGERLDEAAVVRLGRQILSILIYLHELKPPVIHRDIKPSNIIRRDDGLLSLIDFGAVRRPDDVEGSTIVGTYGYMAPEQFRGAATASSDIYSVAATLLFLLTHRPPSELPQQGLRVRFRDHVRVSPAFGAWLDRALEPDPEKRFASAREAYQALTDGPRMVAPRKSRRPLFLGLALALVVAGGAATVYLLDAAPTSSGAVAEPAEPPPAEVDRGAMIPPSRVLRGSWGLVHRVRFAGEGEQVLTASQDGSVREWDADRAEIVHTFGAHAGPGGAIAISRDDTWLAAASGKKVAIYDLESHELRQTLEGPRARVFDVTFDPAGGRVAAASEDGSVTVWSLESGAALHRLEGKGGRAYCALFTPDGQTLLSAGHDGVIHVWNATTGAPERRLEGHRGPVNRLALSADGKTLVSGSDDSTARIWHLPTGQQMHRLDAHVDEVWAVAFSPDEKRIATGGKGDILWQWDVFSGQLVDKRPAMLKGVMDVAYSPDGRRLAAGGVTGVAHLWLTEHALWHPEMPPEDYRRPPPEPIAAATELERLVAEANRALDAQDGGDLQAAQRLINQAASLDPEATAVKVVKARHEYKSGYLSHHDVEPGHLRRAHALLDEALAKDPGSAVAHVTMGWVLRFEKNWGEAKKHAAEARRLDPTDFRSRNLALQLAAEQGQDEAVIEEAKAIFAETKDPDMLEAACDALSDVYRRHRDWAGVDQMYRAQLIYAPESAWLRGNYAQYLVSRHDYPRGIEMAKEALAIRSYPAARRTLARAQAGQASRLAAKHTADGLREARALIAEARSTWRMPDAWVAFFEGLVLIHGADVENDLAAVRAAEAKFQEALRLDPKMTAAKKRIDSSPSVATRIAARK